MADLKHNNLYAGYYTTEEVQALQDINMRPQALLKPSNPYDRKDDLEHLPTWRQKREVGLLAC